VNSDKHYYILKGSVLSAGEGACYLEWCCQLDRELLLLLPYLSCVGSG
jgi:hypothetical protein